jgi:glycosyltransferase involved in cell wall biosynthesis
MRFSIIMASYLSPYKNSAKNPEQKIVRAIESVLKQSYTDWELIVVADGCQKTVETVKPFFYEYLPKIRLIEIPKQKLWSGAVRNTGIFKAQGEIIIYLDADDIWGVNHLQIVNDNFGDSDWVFFNDLKWNGKDFVENHCNPHTKGMCGTSNVAVKRSLGVYWTDNSYLHDYIYIKSLLKESINYRVIPCGEYHIMHVPNGKNAYDL